MRRHVLLLSLVLALCTAGPGPFRAGPAPAREVAPAAEWPWSAMGRLNQAGYRNRIHCTAVLVSPTRALTAAHCVDTALAGSFHLVLGYFGGGFAEHRTVEAARQVPGHEDLAEISWSEPVRARPIPLAQHCQSVGAAVLAGYNHTAPHALTLRRGCGMTGRRGTRVSHSCPSGPGDSGGALLVADPVTGWRLAGIHSASSRSTRLGAAEAVSAGGRCD
ncbi:MAG: trypsin-like serine protease [Pseudomonadota bacterium]|nr:trypsin-like serine protease [Pseudomonadota bacterium]